MKLTILALALSTYRCGATPRKLPAVAEADEEDYYYDGEVNTYYDDHAADADIDDRKKMQVEWFDDKLNLILTMFGTLVGSGAFQSFESAVAFLVGYTAAEYDALLVVWKEKVRHDLVRPTTVIQGTRPERMVRTWGGPHRSSQTMIKRKDVEPYKRVMPHSEYPSGSL